MARNNAMKIIAINIAYPCSLTIRIFYDVIYNIVASNYCVVWYKKLTYIFFFCFSASGLRRFWSDAHAHALGSQLYTHQGMDRYGVARHTQLKKKGPFFTRANCSHRSLELEGWIHHQWPQFKQRQHTKYSWTHYSLRNLQDNASRFKNPS